MPLKRSKRQHGALSGADVAWTPCPGSELPSSTAEVAASRRIIGQGRAIEALELGATLDKPGYNTFVCGFPGSGRTTTIKRVLASLALPPGSVPDLCYVNRYRASHRPRLISLEPGTGPAFRDAMRAAMRVLREQIDSIVNSPAARARNRQVERPYEEQGRALMTAFEERAARAGFTLGPPENGRGVAPELQCRVGEESVAIDRLDDAIASGGMTTLEATRTREAYPTARSDLDEVVAHRLGLQRDFIEARTRVERDAVRIALDGILETTLSQFRTPPIEEWFREIENAVIDDLDWFRAPEGDGAEPLAPADMSAFDVNVVHTSSGTERPIVVENRPTWSNLFGSQDRVAGATGQDGAEFSRITGGSLLAAQGGFLILNATDVLGETGVWPQLMRTLRAGELVIQPPESQGGAGGHSFSPDPITLNTKVILIGDPVVYEGLVDHDLEFAMQFKIKAELDAELDTTPDTIRDFLGAIAGIVADEGLLHLDRDAIAETLRLSARLAAHRGRLSTRFAPIVDALLEADHRARRQGTSLIGATHVVEALAARRRRHDLHEEKALRQMVIGEVLIRTTGSAVGELNGLTVAMVGDMDFGRPVRVSCRVGVGKVGVVNMEREVDLSGSSFDKGVLIIQGYLNGRYADHHPLTFTASLCFEQSHAFVDGDSATSTEVFALLSSLSGVPLRQDLAVTGSIDQVGNVQAVGAVNEKIECFFEVCAARGLTGTQGVIIPEANRDDLVLDRRVVKAIEEGRFHVHPVATVDEGIELLTGVVAGRKNADGTWTRGSFNEAVQQAVSRLNRLARESD